MSFHTIFSVLDDVFCVSHTKNGIINTNAIIAKIVCNPFIGSFIIFDPISHDTINKAACENVKILAKTPFPIKKSNTAIAKKINNILLNLLFLNFATSSFSS